MDETITSIPFPRLLIILIPSGIVSFIIYSWTLEWKNYIYAISRMLGQLIIIGYFLSYIFNSNSSLTILCILISMVLVASWIAFKASLIPIINSLFAVGLVSLPGMMTGQILSGISPLTAARYQIMVMCMIFNSVGLASYIFLVLIRPKKVKK